MTLRASDKNFQTHVDILGPVEAPLLRIAREYRWQLLLRSRQVTYLHRFTHQLLFENQKIFRNRRIKVAVDVDPFFLM
jgi:primosomal protein N' (replication factor Y)